MSTTLVSAPGKVLIAGGYLVLDPKYSGLVVSTSSRFYTLIQRTLGNPYTIWVRSPQFAEASWQYSIEIGDNGSIRVSQVGFQMSKNKFVHIALQQTLQLIQAIRGNAHLKSVFEHHGLEIVILGHNDFYSQRSKLAELNLPPLISSLSKIPPFAYTGVKLEEVHKTGLGSSAALITSLVSCLLIHLSAIEPSSLGSDASDGRALAHNASQFVHCLAQGKVGSGFDVSSAVFGSHVYTRFNPSTIQNLMNENANQLSNNLLSVLSPSNEGWDHRVRAFQLPPYTRLILADVDAGSDTPSLVGKVLAWRKASGDQAETLWNELSAVNNALSQSLLDISELFERDSVAYKEITKRLSYLCTDKWLDACVSSVDSKIAKAFHDVYKLAENIREKMREMGILSGVPIEPPEQAELLDASINQPGVIAGGVPGAGGYDAVWLLVFDHPDISYEEGPISHVERLWMSWEKLNVSPLSATESHAKGLRLEQPEDVPSLSQFIKSV